ncbi:surface lipoprotein assembly modifier [Alteriqipengyuania lutimaris]|nr:porin family protein [Alteriqipengyuania lutimaris]MBB3035438.1 tetratricopeptide (TPR) repeat protein [Alteriqipengyuania lutimaris]
MISRLRRAAGFALALAMLAWPAIVSAQSTSEPGDSRHARVLSPAELFALADDARERGQFKAAENAYRALAQHPQIDLRTEARFRLALMLADDLSRPTDAAVLLRMILDEQPDAARVRVELARMQVMLGNYEAAGRELRAAQAAGVPAEVDRLLRFYTLALESRKPFGANLQVGFAPDSNINRATSEDTLSTIIGDFDLSEDARATSGIGAFARAQGYYRQAAGSRLDILYRLNGQARVYEDGAFNDYALSVQAGPQMRSGSDEITLSAIASQRWFGGKPFLSSYGASMNYRHPMDARTRLTVDLAGNVVDDRLNDLRDNDRVNLAVGVDRAFSARSGGGLRVAADRQMARDPGYSHASGEVQAYLFRELGSVTVVLDSSYSHLEADRRLFLYPRRRIDDRFELGIAGTFRALRVGQFAPTIGVDWEKNTSTVGIYDYQRLSAEVGMSAAF